jgi:hypothetical protein
MARISEGALAEVEKALEVYCAVVLHADLSHYSQDSYINNADNFVRWIKREFVPGSRKAMHRVTGDDPRTTEPRKPFLR